MVLNCTREFVFTNVVGANSDKMLNASDTNTLLWSKSQRTIRVKGTRTGGWTDIRIWRASRDLSMILKEGFPCTHLSFTGKTRKVSSDESN
jgi:hypothetical protein